MTPSSSFSSERHQRFFPLSLLNLGGIKGGYVFRTVAIILSLLLLSSSLPAQTLARRTLAKPMDSAKPSSKKEKPQGFSDNFRLSYTAAVKKYVERSLDPTDKLFHFWDAEVEEEWSLELLKVRNEELVSLGKDRYFAPVDFVQKDVSGEMEDTPFVLDIYGLKVAEGWEIEDIYIRSINDRARYTFDKEYNRIPVDGPKDDENEAKDEEKNEEDSNGLMIPAVGN